MEIIQINNEGLRLIKYFESLQLQSYKDSAGIWCIGWGHTDKEKIGPNLSITEQEANTYLKEDLNKFEEGVLKLVEVPLNENQFSSLVSFSFNLGLGNLQRSTLLRLLNQEDYMNASKEFVKWNRAGGKVLKGLVRRRLSERNLFCSFPKPIVMTLPSNWKTDYLNL